MPPSETFREHPSADGQHGGRARLAAACRFLSAVWEEARAVFNAVFSALLALGAVVGAGYLTGVARAPFALTSDFVALHIADAFRVPAYAIAIYCGAEIAQREAGATIGAKAAALCLALVVVLTVFGITATAVQAVRGESDMNVVLCAYATHVNFGWHVVLLGMVSMVLQISLRDMLPNCVAADTRWANLLSGKRFVMSIVAAVFLAAWVLDGGDAPFGPGPVRYSGMNGYGHHPKLFYVSGLYWTALVGILVLAAHARSHRDERRPARVVNFGVPALAVWIGTGCWIYANGIDQQASSRWQQDHQRVADSGVPHVVAWDIEIDIDPVERSLESRGSALLANVRAEPIRELTLLAPRGAHLTRIDIPNTSALERNPEFHRYAFARPLRSGERVRMLFELVFQGRGLDTDGSASRLMQNGTFLKSGDVVPSFGHDTGHEGERVPATRIRTVIGTSLDQVAIGPGVLLREWKENAGRYFEYARGPHASRVEAPGGPGLAFSIHSGRYAVARRHFNHMTVEVFYHPGHERNIDAMFRCIGKSLASRTRGPASYPDALLRVIEFPYAGETRVAPDAILFSEWREFAFDLRGGRGIDALCESVDRAITRQLADSGGTDS
ncbi:MAG: hypothetical protein OXP28_04280 [Gammaproteobacteria bacterium]|nr:hypothetical protein [Gammaproteobacteria bacterium]